MKSAEEGIRLAKEKRFHEMLEWAKRLNVYDFRDFAAELFSLSDFPDCYERMGESLTAEQLREFSYLGSSEREREYLIKKGQKGDFTDEDYMNLKSCDF